MTTPRTTIEVPVLARVEGEGALHVEIEGGAIRALRLSIYEPPRMFEQLLIGREPQEVIDMVARICGICPVAYQMSAVQALESIFGVDPGPWVRAMRRVMYCGEWIQSHALHIHLLAAPDFLGCNSVVELAAKAPEAVRRGLRLQALGNELIALFGARSVHPVGVRPGGFHREPDRAAVERVRAGLEWAQGAAAELLEWAAGLERPSDAQVLPWVALRHAEEYPMNAGRIASDAGLDIGIEEYEAHFSEKQVTHSTALHATLHGEPYRVGPLARLNLNADRLPPRLRARMEALGLRLPCHDMFQSMMARALEIALAVEEAARWLDAPPDGPRPGVPAPPRAGVGYGATEAPRGLLWHRYETDAHGRVVAARIVPPTSQNQAGIESDLRAGLAAYGLDRDAEDLRARAEQIVRNYDPCISCATHCVRVDLVRRDGAPGGAGLSGCD